MKVTLKGKNQDVANCVEFINELFAEEAFYEEIAAVGSFDYTDLTPKEVMETLKKDDAEVIVKFYRSRWRWSRANAYVSNLHPNTLFLNTRKFGRPLDQVVNTIVHECIHVADYNDNGKIDFGHGSNDSAGKGNSAPYWIGGLAAKFFKEELDSNMEIESIEIDPARIVEEA